MRIPDAPLGIGVYLSLLCCCGTLFFGDRDFSLARSVRRLTGNGDIPPDTVRRALREVEGEACTRCTLASPPLLIAASTVLALYGISGTASRNPIVLAGGALLTVASFALCFFAVTRLRDLSTLSFAYDEKRRSADRLLEHSGPYDIDPVGIEEGEEGV